MAQLELSSYIGIHLMGSMGLMDSAEYIPPAVVSDIIVIL